MPRVTIVMAFYNAAQFLREAVASVFAQTYRDFELIVVAFFEQATRYS